MKFESGMLGFLVIVLAIGGAIAGTIILSAEEQTQEVTKYNLVADVTGLFDTDESPQYMDYDLSRNYTGYYTQNTIVNGIIYWGGADFREASVNNYPVKYAPTESTTSTENLVDLNLSNSNPPGTSTFTLLYYVNAFPTTSGNYGARAQCVSLMTVINEMGLGDYDYITMKPDGSEIVDWIFFGSIDDLQSTSGGSVYSATYTTRELMEQNNRPAAAISMKYNKISNLVELYYDDSLNQSSLARTLSPDKTVIMFSLGDWTGTNNGNYLLEGDTAIVEAWSVPITRYMDVSRGVTITGVDE